MIIFNQERKVNIKYDENIKIVKDFEYLGLYVSRSANDILG